MSIRLGCLCWMALLLAAFGGSAGARAPVPAPAFGPPAILLSPMIPEAATATQARGVFYTATKAVNLISGSVVLESSPDGGALCTDDEARLVVLRNDRVVLRWSHRFNSPDRREIVCLAPQRLTIPGGPGQYQVRIELADLYPPTYGSQPYYIAVAAGESSPELTMPPAAGSAPAAQPMPGAVAATPSEAAQATAQPATAGPAGAQIPSSTAAERIPPAPAPPNNTNAGVQDTTIRGGIAMLILAGGALLALAVIILLLGRRRARRLRRRARLPAGIVYLYDHETREARTAMLDRAGMMAIQRRPLGLVPQALAAADRAVGQIGLDDAGPYLRDTAAGAPNHDTLMRHDATYALAGGAVMVRYRAPATVQPLGLRAGEAQR